MSSSVDRVRQALANLDVDTEITDYPQGTRTAADAAAAIGVPLGSIVKSLIFIVDDEPVLALVAGDQRANIGKLARLLSVAEKTIRFADAETVRAVSGFAIGGVPPVGHTTPMRAIIDRSLSRFEILHAAAGTPWANFPITFDRLVEITAGRVADITDDARP